MTQKHVQKRGHKKTRRNSRDWTEINAKKTTQNVLFKTQKTKHKELYKSKKSRLEVFKMAFNGKKVLFLNKPF